MRALQRGPEPEPETTAPDCGPDQRPAKNPESAPNRRRRNGLLDDGGPVSGCISFMFMTNPNPNQHDKRANFYRKRCSFIRPPRRMGISAGSCEALS